MNKTAAKKTAAKKTAAKKTAAKKTAAKKTAAKKTAANKTAANKTAANKTAANKTAANKTAANKTAANKTAANKTAANKTAANKTAANKTAANKTAANKTAANKTAANKTAANKTAANKTAANKTHPGKLTTPSQQIDGKIEELDDWRGTMLARIRALIKEADPQIVEEWKWRGVPTWYHDSIVCTGESYKSIVKVTFAKGAQLPDPSGLFNSSLDGNVRRAIDFHEGDKMNDRAFKALIRAAVRLNAAKS